MSKKFNLNRGLKTVRSVITANSPVLLVGATITGVVATGILSAIAAALSVAGALLAMANPPPDVVLAIAMTVATLVFGAAAILLLRPRR